MHRVPAAIVLWSKRVWKFVSAVAKFIGEHHKAAAYLSVAAAATSFLSVGTIMVHHADQQMQSAPAAIKREVNAQVKAQMTTLVNKLNATLDYFGAPCPVGTKASTSSWRTQSVLCGINETTMLTRNTLGRIDSLEKREFTRTSDLQKQEKTFADNVNKNLTDLDATILVTKSTIGKANPLLVSLNNEAIELQDSTLALNSILTNTNIPIILGNVNSLTWNANDTIHRWAMISADVYAFEHPLLNPPPCRTKRCRTLRILKSIPGFVGLGADVREISTWWSPLAVKLKGNGVYTPVQ